MDRREFVQQAYVAAVAGGHIFPAYATAEAAEESGFGTSQLAREARNLFGQKVPSEPPVGWQYPMLTLPTQEFIHGRMEGTTANWPIFPDWETSFRERMALLHRVHAYAPALAAVDGEDFVRKVSAVWATDPKRAGNVLEIYKEFCSQLGENNNG